MRTRLVMLCSVIFGIGQIISVYAATTEITWQIGIGIAPTPTITTTSTITRTATISPTSTISPTITPTATITETATISPTASITPTVTQTGTETATLTNTVTYTSTATITHTPTHSPTASHTPTSTVTPSATKTITSSVTATRQPTLSATPTATATTTPWISANQVLLYPNPARDRVYFAYTVSGAVRVTIDIYHLTGERVAHIVEHQHGGAGQTLRTTWQAAEVAPGIYICRIVLTDNSGKVILSKKKKVALIK